MEKFNQPPTRENENVDQGRRAFLRRSVDAVAGVAMLATGLGKSGEAEAFGAMSVESWDKNVDELVVPDKFGDTKEVKRTMKDIYRQLSTGQRMMFGEIIRCRMGGTPTLDEYDLENGRFRVDCK